MLKVRVVNGYGQAKSLAPTPLQPSGSLRYAVFADRPLGPFGIEAWAEDGHGKRLSTTNELVVNRRRRPRAWGRDAPDSPFGTHLNNNPHQLTMAKAIGINWVRLHDAGLDYIGWSFLEPEKGQWRYSDDALHRYRQFHMMLLGMLSTAPGWATSLQQPANGYWDRYVQPLDITGDWRRYVQNVTSRYKDLIRHYEVWNEPWGDYWSAWTTRPRPLPPAALPRSPRRRRCSTRPVCRLPAPSERARCREPLPARRPGDRR